MAKRPAGTGSVYLVKRLPKGAKRWAAEMPLGQDPETGRRRKVTIA